MMVLAFFFVLKLFYSLWSLNQVFCFFVLLVGVLLYICFCDFFSLGLCCLSYMFRLSLFFLAPMIFECFQIWYLFFGQADGKVCKVLMWKDNFVTFYLTVLFAFQFLHTSAFCFTVLLQFLCLYFFMPKAKNQ